jgi:hypothetical protein
MVIKRTTLYYRYTRSLKLIYITINNPESQVKKTIKTKKQPKISNLNVIKNL